LMNTQSNIWACIYRAINRDYGQQARKPIKFKANGSLLRRKSTIKASALQRFSFAESAQSSKTTKIKLKSMQTSNFNKDHTKNEDE